MIRLRPWTRDGHCDEEYWQDVEGVDRSLRQTKATTRFSAGSGKD